jgi:ATP-dependent DNA helicase RecG
VVTDNGLSQPVSSLSGVGPKVAEKLEKIGIQQVQDLLFHLPLRYQDRTRLMPMGALRPQQEVLIEGTIQLSQIRFGRRRALLVHVSDGTGSIYLRFFHFFKS